MSENIQKEIGRWQRVAVRGMSDRQGAAAVQGPRHLHPFHSPQRGPGGVILHLPLDCFLGEISPTFIKV